MQKAREERLAQILLKSLDRMVEGNAFFRGQDILKGKDVENCPYSSIRFYCEKFLVERVRPKRIELQTKNVITNLENLVAFHRRIGGSIDNFEVGYEIKNMSGLLDWHKSKKHFTTTQLSFAATLILQYVAKAQFVGISTAQLDQSSMAFRLLE